MIEVSGDQARTLAVVIQLGSFEAAARELSVTPSAISQRMRALEIAVGRPVLRRTRPVELTAAGEAVVRFAEQLELLGHDLSTDLDPGGTPSRARVAVVINSDSLSWVLPALVEVAPEMEVEVLREDQDHSLSLLRNGSVAAAITSEGNPVPGCSVRRLGSMRYRPVAAPAFAKRWFGDGLSAPALRSAPVVVFDRRDDLQDGYLRRRARGSADPPRFHVPASHEYGEAVRLGLGWGLLPDHQVGDDLDRGVLVALPGRPVLVKLHWQQWRRSPRALTRLAEAVARAASGALR